MAKFKDKFDPKVLPPSGPLSISQIKGEFNKGNTFSSYYGAASGIPASGRMSVSDFYGKSDAPPPGVNQILWKPGENATPKGMIPAMRVTQNAHTASGSPDNIKSTTAGAGMAWNDSTIDCNLFVTAKDSGAHTRILNPKAEVAWNVKDWIVPDTALGCKIKFTYSAVSSEASIVNGTPRHYFYAEPYFGVEWKDKVWEGSGGSYTIPSFAALSWTSTQTIHEYKSNNQPLIMDVWWNKQGNNLTTDYNRYNSGDSFYVSLRMVKIEGVA